MLLYFYCVLLQKCLQELTAFEPGEIYGEVHQSQFVLGLVPLKTFMAWMRGQRV